MRLREDTLAVVIACLAMLVGMIALAYVLTLVGASMGR